MRVSTSPIRIPPLAISSRIILFRTLAVRKITSSIVSLSKIFHCTHEGRLKIFLRIGEMQGFWRVGNAVLMVKLKNDDRVEYLFLFVA